MVIRKDVWHLAEKLHDESGISTDPIYSWLMDLGKLKGINPCRLSFRTANGTVYYDSENYLRIFNPVTNEPYDDGAADYWYNQIMEKQEAWMD